MPWRILFIFLSLKLSGQTIEACKQRFNNYLNFRGSLTHLVSFQNGQISILNTKGLPEFTVYENELALLSSFFESSTVNDQMLFYSRKANKKLSKRQRDSIQIYTDSYSKPKLIKGSLKAVKIAIDPGHIAGSFSEAMNEQKFLYFVKDSLLQPNDSVKIYESELTFKTALILKKMLEEKGANVMLSRTKEGNTSFGISYAQWFEKNKAGVLDSLLFYKKISSKQHKHYSKLDSYPFFWEFFKDYELKNRANIINKFKPHATVIIHFNVDEKNNPWKKTSDQNYTMAFIGGAYTPKRFDDLESKMHFLRLLFTNHLEQSEKLSFLSISQFNENLKIPIACNSDADYLLNNCITLSNPGVYSRQLALCNSIQSPLVYGESLYQDNAEECKKLMDNRIVCQGVITNERVKQVALSYYNALLQFFNN